jgi:DNA repair exonuclease SbcCD ATPase subunit/DNA repair exonuclease SbcCD nuclease subunit
MKIAHLADTHIKTLQDHKIYKQVFEQIYEKLREERVNYIVHCGDIAHSKTQISPEFVEMASDFFKNLSSIAPTFVILGNHDGNLKNSDRQDAISPIINALELDNLYLLKDSGEFEVNKDLSLNVLSIFDEGNWVKPKNSDKINIALYHGCIAGCKTDTGYIMTKGDHEVSIFDGHDFAFLGDIHTTHQVMDTEGRVRYPGSTVQQNFAETNDKGFLVWDIKSKDNFTCKHVSVKNPHPYVTIELDSSGNVPEVLIETGSRVRIFTNKNITLDKVKKAKDIIKNRFTPLSITYLNKPNSSDFDSEIVSEIVSQKKNLRDVSFQEKLIEDFLKDYKVSKDLKNKIFELNKKYNSSVVDDSDISRNINWKLKRFEWDNLFNYGDGNSVNFADLNGVIGIFGKNYSGKSSIIDGILYTLFNTTSKNNRKNLNVINQNLQKGRGKLEIEINGEDYAIERVSEKYTKKSKGVEITEAKTDVVFTGNSESMNGLDRNDTDKNIRKYFGTVDDFFLTSMATQFGYLSFVSEGSTNRKQILAKFLDLESFEKKFKLAKEDSSEIKALVKRLELNSNYDELIRQAEFNVSNSKLEAEDKSYIVKELLNDVQELNNQLQKITDSLKNIPSEIIDYGSTIQAINKLKTSLETTKTENINLVSEISKLQLIVEKANEFLATIDNDQLQKDDIELAELNKKIVPLEREISALSSQLKNAKHKLELLESVPCGDSFPSCKFIKDAFEYRSLYPALTTEFEQKNVQITDLNEKYDSLEEKLADLLNKKSKITQKKLETEKLISNNQLKIERNNLSVEKASRQIEEFEQKVKTYEENKEAIENYLDLQEKKKKLQQNIKEINDNIEKIRHEMNVANVSYGSSLKEVESLKKQKADLERLREEYTAYELYQKCMHPSGISYEIIKQKLPEINSEIAKILNNVVDFNIFLENDDDKLDIIIKHQNMEPRPLEMGSGAEKTLASIAIRLALLSVTSLPVSDIFIMDEPGTALDESNLQGFVKILDMIKSYFKTVLIISHLDVLKECVDGQILINKKGEYAFVEQ